MLVSIKDNNTLVVTSLDQPWLRADFMGAEHIEMPNCMEHVCKAGTRHTAAGTGWAGLWAQVGGVPKP